MKINLNENIKKFRIERGLTQENFASFLGVTFQSVSKWERGESYPDITLLPEIAAFFKVTVDELLGINENINEIEIVKALGEYDKLRDEWENEKVKREIIECLKDKYPSDFRVQLKYLRHIITYEYKNADRKKVQSIYDNIQKNCTNDAIRIEAKNIYISYCLGMGSVKDSGITFEDAYEIIEELPAMKDCREGFAFVYLPDEIDKSADFEKVHDAIEEAIDMLYSLLSSYYFCRKKFPMEYQINILEKTADFFNYIYDDGNYGRMWTTVINGCYGMLGLFYYWKADFKKAYENLHKSAELAVKFDTLERFTVMESTLFKGRIFDKHIMGSDLDIKKKLKKSFLTDYGFSDDFKREKEFEKIISLLE